jgi:uncharacterized protein YcbK (DUF882 family)
MNKHNDEKGFYKPSFNEDERLTEHFTLREMLYSYTCEKLGMVNRVDEPEIIIPRLRTLCERVLEPLRRKFGPIRINSGYRSECLNYVVGGVTYSQHILGEAADINTPNLKTAKRYMDFIEKNLEFDQLLLEQQQRTGHVWVHVSYTERKPNRKMVRFIV